MATEFFKSIPPEIVDKLRERSKKDHEKDGIEFKGIENFDGLISFFFFHDQIEGSKFWWKHHRNNTFPRWSEELNRFIN